MIHTTLHRKLSREQDCALAFYLDWAMLRSSSWVPRSRLCRGSSASSMSMVVVPMFTSCFIYQLFLCSMLVSRCQTAFPPKKRFGNARFPPLTGHFGNSAIFQLCTSPFCDDTISVSVQLHKAYESINTRNSQQFYWAGCGSVWLFKHWGNRNSSNADFSRFHNEWTI